MQMREKVGKSRKTVFFQWFVAPEGRKVGSLKRRVRSHLARWEMKNCTPLWREAHFEVKMYKTHQLRTTFWKLRCRKSACRCGAKHISKSKCTKHTILGPLLGVEMSKKCTPLWREARLQVKKLKNTSCSEHFWKLRCRKSARRCGAKHISKSKCEKHYMFAPLLDVEMSFREAGAGDCAPCQKWANCEGFLAFPKTMGGVGHLKRICKDAFSVAGTAQETCSSELLEGPGADFPERGCILEPEIFRFAEVILGDRCSTSYDLASLFRGRRSNLDRWIGKIAKRIGTRPSALHATFHFWRKSRRIASFLMLSTLKNDAVS